jgi:hypothetical protein
MQAEHFTFSSERQANEAYRRFRQRGWHASTPFQDEHRNWCITVIFYGR